VPSDYPELLGVPKGRYEVVDEETFPGLSAFESRAMALGAEYRVVVTHPQNLCDLQARGFIQTLAKAT